MDPKTGEMRAPTAAELAAMEQQESKLQGTTERRKTESKLRGGGKAIILRDNMETPLQACVNADGTMVLDHECQKTQQPQQDSKGGKP